MQRDETQLAEALGTRLARTALELHTGRQARTR